MPELVKKIGHKIKRELQWLGQQFVISKNLKSKLKHNYHGLSWLEKALYWIWYRRNLSPEERFFFEGERGLAGQMYIADRRGLYETIREFKPKHCLEIGTWEGGGSTLFISSALAHNGAGTLHTTEADPWTHSKAKNYYQRYLPTLNKHVDFILSSSVESFLPALAATNGLEACFLDGAEDSQETLAQYRFLEPHFHPGTILMAHDWNTDKMAALKPVLLSKPHWKLIKQIDPPDSVGFVVFKYE